MVLALLRNSSQWMEGEACWGRGLEGREGVGASPGKPEANRQGEGVFARGLRGVSAKGLGLTGLKGGEGF